MFRALYTAASGMIAQQLNLDNIANNLANASTAGFRKTRLQFQDLIYQDLVVPGSKLGFSDWWSTTAGDRLVRLPASALDHRHFWDAMDTLSYEHLQQIQHRV